jgi:hypothetical protein
MVEEAVRMVLVVAVGSPATVAVIQLIRTQVVVRLPMGALVALVLQPVAMAGVAVQMKA